MSQLHNLSATSRARINAKLTELQRKTGQTWALEVTKQPGGINGVCLLEISVDGRIARPIALENNREKAADRICRELDHLYAQKELQRHHSAGKPRPS